MLDKSSYYHGAALIGVLEDQRCQGVRKRAALGYVVNGDIFLFLKYTTKTRSPWRFVFDQEDINRCVKMSDEYRRVLFGLICGGDGVCAVDWINGRELLNGLPGWIAAARKHKHRYEVWGSAGELTRKVPLRDWPELIFETNVAEGDNIASPVYAGTESQA